MKIQSALVVLVTTAACARTAPTPTPDQTGLGGTHLAVATVAVEAAGPDQVVVPATVLARERATLAARVPGSVVALPYREGQAVRKGDIVAHVDARTLGSALEAAEAERTAAETDLERVETLLSRGAATAQEADQARARAAAARAGVASAHDALGHAVLRAPFTGRVSARLAHVGDVVMPGTPIVELEGADGLEVVGTVEATGAGRVRIGALVSVEVDGQAAPLTAVVRAVSEAGDPVTHRVQLRADLPEAEGLRSGLFARLSLPSGDAAASDAPRLTVPASAVLRRGGLTGVYVISAGRARLRWIAVGETRGSAIEVRAGLERGERVVSDPAGLTDGAVVREG